MRSSRDFAPLPDEEPEGIGSGSELESSAAEWGQVGAVNSSHVNHVTDLDQCASGWRPPAKAPRHKNAKTRKCFQPGNPFSKVSLNLKPQTDGRGPLLNNRS